MATSSNLKSELDKVNSFILDITNVRYFRVKFADILEKYTAVKEDEDFAEDLKAIIASRNGYQKILTKYDAIKVKLQRQMSGIPMTTPEVVVSAVEEIAIPIEPVLIPIVEVALPIVETPAPKKSKKSKRSKK
jgi:hypothetical protein